MGKYTAIGLMSGTSLDGVDAALLETDGETEITFGPAHHRPFSRADKVWVQRAVKAALEGRDGAEDIKSAAAAVTKAHIAAVEELLSAHEIDRATIDVIGFHGQTILHRPARSNDSVGRTWQIGDAAEMAEALGVDVVADFRTADVEAGGEGAPLAPIYHAALARDHAHRAGVSAPIAVLNLGGVANVSFVPLNAKNIDLVAFDCGPGNGLIDQWMDEKTGEPIDRDGRAARAGVVHEDILRMMLLNPFLRRSPPKSLDRYDFKLDPVKGLPLIDGAATLTAFTAHCVAAGAKQLPTPPAMWIVVGGGRRNPVLMEMLGEVLDAPVYPAEEAGWRGDDLEAECFAYLAVRMLRQLPISFPKTTRAPSPLTGGVLFQAPKSAPLRRST